MALLDRIDLDELAFALQTAPSVEPSVADEVEIRRAVEVYRAVFDKLGHERGVIFAGGYLLANAEERWSDLVDDFKARCVAVYRGEG
jgi:hypothetical protein